MNAMEKQEPLKGNLVSRILHEKCPNCGRGEVYEKKKTFFELPVMKERCNVCNYYFDREPGYFIGAMYISYGLAVLQGILTFLILYFFFPTVPTIWVVLIILAVILAFSLKNYKLSRIIYIHIFPY
ncbi:MAG: DUF983 domain-containing protein [Bacteroidetes bacterium]|nr:DUF983 domain-containing protein [Bacteroidota bacterium]